MEGGGGGRISVKEKIWQRVHTNRTPKLTWRTLMDTWVWLSAETRRLLGKVRGCGQRGVEGKELEVGKKQHAPAAVEKVWDFLVGMVVLRGMSLVITPPRVSMPAKIEVKVEVKGREVRKGGCMKRGVRA